MSPFRHGEKIKHRKVFNKLIISFLTILFVVGGAIIFWYQYSLRPVDLSQKEEIIVTVEPGMNEAQFAAVLEDKSLIRSAITYEIFVRINNKTGQMQAGGYKLSKNMSVSEIVGKITKGEVSVDLITILPGQRLEQIKEDFKKAGYSDEEIEVALEPNQYAGHPALVDKPPLATLEGYLYPESFQRTINTPLKLIIEASLDQMAILLNDKTKQKLLDQGITVYEAIILASIVEGEVSQPKDRAIVAQVFLKRLREGMMLQSNATDGLPENFDTYSIEGLPPEPISNITSSSLMAVANPSDTEYLYFVSGSDCKTRFSNSNEEHESLISRYGVATAEDKCI